MAKTWLQIVRLEQPADLLAYLNQPAPTWSNLLSGGLGERKTLFSALWALVHEAHDIYDHGDSLVEDHGFDEQRFNAMGNAQYMLHLYFHGRASVEQVAEALPVLLESLDLLNTYYAKKVNSSQQLSEETKAALYEEIRLEREQDLVRPEKRLSARRRSATVSPVVSLERHRRAIEEDQEIGETMVFFDFDQSTYKMLQGPSEAVEELDMKLDLLHTNIRRNSRLNAGLTEVLQQMRAVPITAENTRSR